MTNFIISTSQGGLSNRIKCLISSMKIADKTNRKLLLFWSKDKSCNCNFKDLFENKIKEISKEDLKKIIITKKYEIYQDSLKNFKNKKKFILIDNAKLLGFLGKDIYIRFNEIPKEIKEGVLKYFKKLKIKKGILKKVQNFSKRFNKNTVGIHARKGDFKILKSGIGIVSTNEKFFEKIKEIIEKNSKVKFFLSTGCKDTEKKYIKKFGKKIILFNKKTRKREEENSVQEAFIDLLLLSKTKVILGTYGSTFSETAWWLNNCKSELIIIYDKENLKKYMRIKNKEKNLKNKFKRFLYELMIPKSRKFFKVVIK